MDEPQRKRHRVPASCSVCRRRKSRCDRVKPVCGSCKKKSISHLCYYESHVNDDFEEGSNSAVLAHGLTNYLPIGVPVGSIPHLDRQNTIGTINGSTVSSQLGNQIMDFNDHLPHFAIPQQQNSNNLHQSPTSFHFDTQMGGPFQQGGLGFDAANPNIQPGFNNGIQHFSLSEKGVQQLTFPTHPINLPPLNDSLPPSTSTKLSPKDDLVSISIGPNSTLRIDPNDTMNLLTNSSYALDVDGGHWQSHGPFSYVGILRSDPFIKILRHYVLQMFQTGNVALYILAERSKRQESIQNQTNLTAQLNAQTLSRSAITHDRKLDRNSVLSVSTPLFENIHSDPKSLPNDRFDVDVPDSTHERAKRAFTQNDDGNIIPEPTFNFGPMLKGYLLNSKDKFDLYSIGETMVLRILPCMRSTDILITRFFNYVYPVVPIIEKEVFIQNLNEIFPEQFPCSSSDYRTEARITTDQDLATLGILLLVIRMGHMSLLCHDSSGNHYHDDEIGLILEMRKINPDTFNSILGLCIPDHISLRASLRTVQCLYLWYFYRKVAPNDSHGLGGSDAEMVLSAIIKQAVSIGLNRDPTFFTNNSSVSKDASLIRTWRILWNLIVIADANQAIQCGTPLSVLNLDQSDVKDPELGFGDEVEFTFSYHNRIANIYRKVADLINNVKHSPKILDLLVEAKNLEQVFFELFGKDYFKDNICKLKESNPEEKFKGFMKVYKYTLFLDMRTNLSCLYYKIALHYEQEYGKSPSSSMTAGIELFKIHIKSVVQLIYIMSHVLDNQNELFDENYDYLLTSVNERNMIRTHSLMTSLFARIMHYKQTLTLIKPRDSKATAKARATSDLFQRVLDESEIFIGHFKKLSKTYINSYKVYVMTYFVLKQSTVDVDVFFKKEQLRHSGTNMFQFFSVDELEYLCKLTEEIRTAKVEQAKITHKRHPLISLTPRSILFGIDLSVSPSGSESSDGNSYNLKNAFGTPYLSNEELLRLFEVYVDADFGDDD